MHPGQSADTLSTEKKPVLRTNASQFNETAELRGSTGPGWVRPHPFPSVTKPALTSLS